MPRSPVFGLLAPRQVMVPTWRGWILLAAIAGLCAWAGFMGIHPFLAARHPVGGPVLVVEGWMPDYALRESLDAFRSGGYRKLLVTGGPLPPGFAFSNLGTHARLAADMLRGMGLGGDSLAVAPSEARLRDRTYEEGLAVAAWIDSAGETVQSLDLASFSTHARRSRLLYAGAIGKRAEVGILAMRDIGYDPARWWRSSIGVRSVIDEAVAYLYARLVFRPRNPAQDET